jgi:hypothetical protein
MSTLFEKDVCIFIQDENEEKYELMYKVFQHGNTYSLLVIMTESHGLSDSVFLYDITRDESTACEIVEILSSNAVTPCTVTDILEDLFSEFSFHHPH